MSSRNLEIDTYLSFGCGRCPLGGTPECKVHAWQDELRLLREIVLDCGLTEERKWGVPCYTIEGKNVSIVSALKSYALISFFKGVLISDRYNILEKPGENCQSDRVVKFTSVDAIRSRESVLRDYLHQAIEIERSGEKVKFDAKVELELPSELANRLTLSTELKRAWENLTPGRKRGYVLFISAAKQSKTREARIDKYISSILAGKGMHDQ
ncbi:MAG: YdeI/OmpD-associated family protein [Pirellula sp.]|jgi:uncharacterized protein YdeI (YjbR/CyaY-like superfamily)|nr:YdeI/OmpD-associated family protein [Pirellula sp.]